MMKELAKSMISFSWAMGLASVRGAGVMMNQKHRERFFKETEGILHDATDATVDGLGRNLRETFHFADNIQRRVIDTGSGALNSVVNVRGRNS